MPSQSRLELLNQHEWQLVLQEGKEYSYTEHYTKDKIIGTFHFDGKDTEVKNLYYLSDSITFVFDFTKIGKSLNGRYIISHYDNDKISKTNVYDILTLNDSIFTLKGVFNPDSTRIHIGGGQSVTYKAIKR